MHRQFSQLFNGVGHILSPLACIFTSNSSVFLSILGNSYCLAATKKSWDTTEENKRHGKGRRETNHGKNPRQAEQGAGGRPDQNWAFANATKSGRH